MGIGRKIILSTAGMVFLAVLLTVASVIWFLNRGIETQTRELLTELRNQSRHRINAGQKILHHTIANDIQRIRYETSDTCLDRTVRLTIALGQWKALLARTTSICRTAGIDFMVVFSTTGKVLSTYPGSLNEMYPEAHFREFGISRGVAPAIAQHDLTGAAITSFLVKWDREILNGYEIDKGRDPEIVILSAGVIPNDFMDAPVGYVLTGISGSRLFAAFNQFSKVTGQVAWITDNGAPLVWGGVSGNREGNAEAADVPVYRFIIGTPFGSEWDHLIQVGGDAFNCVSTPLDSFFGLGDADLPISLSKGASACRIIVGEPSDLIDSAGREIVNEGSAMINRILTAALLIAFGVLALTLGLMRLISRRIVKPIALAADMSDQIASGDLSRVLDETGSDETAMLSKSMNLMVEKLNALEQKNRQQVRDIEENENRFRKLFNTSHRAIALVDRHTGIFTDANARLFEISQYKRAEIIGRTAEQIGFHTTGEGGVSLRDQLMEKGGAKEWEAELCFKDGTTINIMLFSVPVSIRGEEFFLIEFYDITEKKRLESQLKHSLKMESIGTLAGGIAHDFNNILGVILSNTELALMDAGEDHPVYECLTSVKTASLMAADVISQLLSYTRSSEKRLTAIDIGPVIDETVNFLRSSIPNTVRIRNRIEDSRLIVMADPVQINQVLINLGINAYQSMADAKGIIEIRSGTRVVDPDMAKEIGDLKPGRHVRIEISDNGAGIPPEIISRIFDPYFTTKGVGKGSGMGLAVVHGIIQTHQGAIRVASTPGTGTRFNIYLPVSDSPPVRETASEPEAVAVGSGTILLVDDDGIAIGIYEKLFTRMGYRVHAYTDPQQALAELKRNPGAFDLVFTDMTMPDMTGADLAQSVKAERRDIPIIIFTGHSDRMDEQKAKEIGIAAYVMKPIEYKKISNTIHRVLNAHKRGPEA